MIDALVLAPCRPHIRERLERDFAGTYRFAFRSPEDLDQLPAAEVVIGEPPVEALSTAWRLRWVQMTWAGTDLYTRHPGFPAGVVLTNGSGAYGRTISEYVIGAILAHYRNLPRYWDQQKQGLWRDAGAERCLDGRTVLILGAGDLGRQVAKKLRAFDTVTLGVKRTVTGPVEGFDRLYPISELDRALPEAQVVIGCLPNTDETIGLLDGRRLRLMRPDALLVNVGRGKLIVTDDLVEVLRSRHLSGAALDVTEPEPLPADHPLWSLPNVTITPHVSGPSFHHDLGTEERIWALCADNLRRYAAGEPLAHVVDLVRGY